MALSRELRKRLNSEDEPLEKRLKLAENVYCSAELAIIRKEELILQWLCNLLTKENVWKTLKQCLRSEQFNIKSDMKEKLIDNCIEKLNKNLKNVTTEVFECCSLLLSNPGMQKYFSDVPNKFGVFVKTILLCIDCLLYQIFDHKNDLDDTSPANLINKDDIPVSLVYSIAVSIVENIIQILKCSVSTKHELRIAFLQDILYLLCKITSYKCIDDGNTLEAAVYRCIQQFIYGRHKYGSHKVIDIAVIPDIFPTVCHVLEQCTKENKLEDNLIVFQFVFQTAISFYKSDPPLLDLVFRDVLDSAGQYKLQILNSFFKYLKDIPFNYDNEIKNVTLYQYLHKIIDDILSNKHLSAIDYEILSGIAYLNPLVIVSKIPQILVKVYLEQKVTDNVRLMTAIVDASIKLRNEEKLIPQLLVALKEALLIKEKSNAKVQKFFPLEFQNKLTNSVCQITQSQVLSILKSLVDVLHKDGMEVLNSDNTCNNIILIRASVELLVAIFDGIRFFEARGTLTTHTMFTSTLNELGKAISHLLDKALELSYNDSLITLLLSLTIRLYEVQRVLKFYVPKAEELLLPISDDQWKQLIQKIKDCGGRDSKENMNKLMLYRIKDNQTNTSSIKLKSMIDGLDHAWRYILKDNAELIIHLHRKETCKMTLLMLSEMVSDKSHFDYWLEQIKLESLQENRMFIGALITTALLQIGMILDNSVTYQITKHINTKDVVDEVLGKNTNLIDTLNVIREDISNSEWISMKYPLSEQIVPYLKILLHLPIKFLSTNVRTLLFLVIHVVSKECDTNEEIQLLCDEILSDLIEKSAIDTQQLGPRNLLYTLQQRKVAPKILEHSLKNITSYAALKDWVKFSIEHKDSMFLLLKCIANVKPKLDNNKKGYFEKAERKLLKATLKILENEVKVPSAVQNLALLLKVSTLHKKGNDKLKDIANSTLFNIFLSDEKTEVSKELIEEGLELAFVMSKYPKEFPLSNRVIKQIWRTMLRCPHKNLLPHLMSMTGPEEFQEILKLLQHQIVKDLSDDNEISMINNVLIWNTIMQCDMLLKRKQLRLAAIDNLLQIVQLSHISEKLWPTVLKLLNAILVSKHLHISSRVVDITISISIRSLEEVKDIVCNETLALCTLLVKNRTSLITDRLPALLLLYRRIIQEIVQTSKNVIDKRTEHHCRCLALDFEKLTASLIKLRKDVARLSPYVISDIISILSESAVPSFIKDSVENCISHLISVCDQYALALLFRALPVSMQELFKVYLERFKKFHKFSGKI